MKNSFPLIILFAAALFFFWIKKHQQRYKGQITPASASEAYTLLRGGSKPIMYSRHARCRMSCRHINEAEVKEILEHGTVNFNKIESDARGKTFPVEGLTHDGQNVRIVFAPHEKEITVVTVIDTDKEWPCECN